MTTLREAAQAALEAMESAEVDPHSSDAVYKVTTALRVALAEPEDDALTAAYMLGRHDSKWCPIHQHYKWCEHNGGVMGPTGWEKPPHGIREPE